MSKFGRKRKFRKKWKFRQEEKEKNFFSRIPKNSPRKEIAELHEGETSFPRPLRGLPLPKKPLRGFFKGSKKLDNKKKKKVYGTE